MEEVALIDPDNEPDWDRFVKDHSFGWICHLSGWKQVLEKSFKHMKGHYIALLDKDTHAIRTALPLFEVRSWLTGKRLVSIPFATLCDPLISSSKDFKILFEHALRLSTKLGTSYVEIRVHKSDSLIHDSRLGVANFYKNHYLPLDSEPEQLKKNFHRTCVRQRISRALKSNLTLNIADSISDLHDFYRLYLISRKRHCLPPQPYIFFKSLFDTFVRSNQMSLLLAQKQGVTVAGLIILKFKDRVSAEVIAQDPACRDASPNHFVFWEAIKLAHSEGYKIFDFGRTSPNNQGLMDFKKHWGTKVIDLPQYYYPRHARTKISGVEESLRYKMVRGVCKGMPVFASKYIGNFCYRHLG